MSTLWLVNTMPHNIIGWDIGGAHLKAALVDRRGTVLKIRQEPCPLWKGLTELEQAVNRILDSLVPQCGVHALTMTGELVDLFNSREQGVIQITRLMAERLGNAKIFLYAGTEGFISPSQLTEKNWERIASANWLASANYAASKVQSALFIDIGSTTTDILIIDRGQVKVSGLTDFRRLRSGELVYTGIVRTPVMSLGQPVEFEGEPIALMAEYFATMADVYRLTGELNECHDQAQTADGAPKSLSASARRLARMIGCDFLDGEMVRWQRFAANLRRTQLDTIIGACSHILAKNDIELRDGIVCAGIGRFLVKDIANHLQLDYRDFNDLAQQPANQEELSIADCAPAVSVGCLALTCR